MANIIKTTFKFKRGLAMNWTAKNPILEAGEPGFELDTGKLKIGNGTTPWNELEYINDSNSIVNGYYWDNNFYKDIEHSILLDKALNTLYIENNTNILYFFNGTSYISLGNGAPIATEDISGTVKIYNTVGEQTDGTMTQKAISDELDDKIEMQVNNDEEMLILGYDLI